MHYWWYNVTILVWPFCIDLSKIKSFNLSTFLPLEIVWYMEDSVVYYSAECAGASSGKARQCEASCLPISSPVANWLPLYWLPCWSLAPLAPYTGLLVGVLW